MEDKMIEKAEEALRFLAAKMGVATSAFWPTFIRKQILDAVVAFIWVVIAVPAALKFAPICFKWPATPDLSQYDLDLELGAMRLLGVVLCGVALNTFHTAIEQVKYLGNLRYWALKDFVSTLSKLLHK